MRRNSPQLMKYLVPDDIIDHRDWNGLVYEAQQQETYNQIVRLPKGDPIQFVATEDIPSYSVFGFQAEGGSPDATEQKDRVRVSENKNPTIPLYFTNGKRDIPENTIGWCEPIQEFRPLKVKITPPGAGTIDVGDLVDFVPGSFELAKTATASGFAVLGVSEEDDVYFVMKVAASLNSGAVFPITLLQTGGAAGSSTTQTSWTYTVNHGYTGTELATGVDPTASPHLYRREAVGKLIAAVTGIAFYNSIDELVIIDIREPLDASEC